LSRKNIVISAIAALALLALGGLGYYLFQRYQGGQASAPEQEASSAAPGAGAPVRPAGKLPDPVFVVLDKAAVVRESKAGKDIARQLQPVVRQIEAGLLARREALDRDAQALERDSTIAPADREKRITALGARQNAINEDAQKRQQQVQTALAAANGELSKAMVQIVPGIVKAHGANMVLDAAVLPKADPAFDITKEVIDQLDARVTAVKLPLEGLK